MSQTIADSDYKRQNRETMEQRLKPVINALDDWLTGYPKQTVYIMVVENAQAVHRTIDQLANYIQVRYPKVNAHFWGVESKYKLADDNQPDYLSFLNRDKCERDRFDAVIDIFTMHELLNNSEGFNLHEGKNRITELVKEWAKDVLQPGGLLLVIDGVLPNFISSGPLAVNVSPDFRKIIQIMQHPVYCYMPIDFSGVDTNKDTVDLFPDQLLALSYSMKYLLRAIHDTKQFLRKLEIVGRKVGVPGYMLFEYSSLIRNYLPQTDIDRLKLINEVLSSSNNTLSPQTIEEYVLQSLLQRWEKIERYKQFYYFTIEEWKKLFCESGFTSVSAHLIEDLSLEQSLEHNTSNYPNNIYRYDKEKRKYPYGHSLIIGRM